MKKVVVVGSPSKEDRLVIDENLGENIQLIYEPERNPFEVYEKVFHELPVDPNVFFPDVSKSNPVLQDIRREPKIRRNELCPCNSGKKYKNCCINKE